MDSRKIGQRDRVLPFYLNLIGSNRRAGLIRIHIVSKLAGGWEHLSAVDTYLCPFAGK